MGTHTLKLSAGECSLSLATAWSNIDNLTVGKTTETNGFYISCMTGIAQCGNNVTTRVQTSLSTLLTLAEHAACMADPRYLTWRLMTISMEYDGSINWARTDSFWDPSAMVIASSWGPMHGPGVNAGHWWSGADNTIVAATTTDAGKPYVFALSDALVFKCRTLPEEQDWFQCLQLSRPPVLAATLSQLRQLVSQTCPPTASIRASVPRPTCLSLVWLTLPLLPTQLPPTLTGTRLPSRWRLTGSRWVPKAAG